MLNEKGVVIRSFRGLLTVALVLLLTLSPLSGSTVLAHGAEGDDCHGPYTCEELQGDQPSTADEWNHPLNLTSEDQECTGPYTCERLQGDRPDDSQETSKRGKLQLPFTGVSSDIEDTAWREGDSPSNPGDFLTAQNDPGLAARTAGAAARKPGPAAAKPAAGRAIRHFVEVRGYKGHGAWSQTQDPSSAVWSAVQAHYPVNSDTFVTMMGARGYLY